MTTISKTPLTLGGRQVHLAALSLQQLRDLKPQINICIGPGGGSYLNDEAADALVDLLMASTKSAGNALDRDFLMQHIDIANYADIGFRLFDKNGFVSKEPVEGEATAAASST